MEKLIVSTSPHLRSTTTTQTVMRDVLIALLPATVASVVLFGIKAAFIVLACVASAVLSEALFCIINKRPQTVGDLSAAVTGLLLALNLPAKTEIWQCVVGSVFAIIVVKCLFGGIGCNFANPAITGRIFMLICFAKVAGGSHTVFADVTSGATPLAAIKAGEELTPTLTDMLIGNRGGAIGETCAVALLLGFIYLVLRRVIHWETPVIFMGTVFVLSLIIKGDLNAALYQLLGGGLIIGAVFMATDYVTTPINRAGKCVFALGCGIITVLIRFWGSYPEGVSFSILLMNILSPYIEKMCAKKPLGGVKNA
ncbi:MAG: RnfABCDGE type electron transport complex subunit D [Clostridia bacterium]|nr:RnfABCDGE type electron transport complex subunit D [Clostridia bacterium]MBQ5649839.1 RnfABCDGE type electron transport complex subunit D [Clostridia bacterium]MBR0327233.1 RnfABCDGE type electron transport complex subunit D [Clostridia bacterium]